MWPNTQYNQDGPICAILRPFDELRVAVSTVERRQARSEHAQEERTRTLLRAQEERSGSEMRTVGERSRILGLAVGVESRAAFDRRG